MIADPAPVIRHAFADVDGIRLHYAASGDPDGELVLLLHGFPEFWYMWKDVLVDLGRDRLAVAPDQRGYNLSDRPDGVDDYRIDRLTGDVAALADRLGKDRFALVGHDWGGVVAWALAMARPERVEKLVVVNAPHPAIFARELATNPDQREASAYMNVLRSPAAEGVLSADGYAVLVADILDPGVREGWLTEADRAAYLEAWSRPGGLTGALNWYRAAEIGPPAPGEETRTVPERAAALVRVPTLVIWGERDNYLLPGNLDGLENLVPDLIVRRVPDAGHWIVRERSDRVRAWIRDFLER